MKIQTKHFGEITIDEEKLITFNEGIPGFANLRKFTLIRDEEEEKDIFYWLQSIEDKDIAFVLLNMLHIMPTYNPVIYENDIENLGTYDEDTFTFYNIATIPNKLENMTVNLKAPLIINSKTKLGKQVICTNEEYSVRHKVFDSRGD